MAAPQTQQTQTKTPDDGGAKASKFIFIDNTSRALIGIPAPVPKKKEGEEARPGSFISDIQVNLKPGLNRVLIADWEVAKKQQMVQLRIDEGIIREVASINSLRDVSPDEARKLIAGIVDEDQLLEWKEVDKRRDIQKAIDQRIADLQKPEPGSAPPKFRGGV